MQNNIHKTKAAFQSCFPVVLYAVSLEHVLPEGGEVNVALTALQADHLLPAVGRLVPFHRPQLVPGSIH